MTKFANQREVTIHKDKYYQNFLQVGIDEWREAFTKLNRGAFGLYLYLSGNMDTYKLGLSSAAVQNILGVSDSTYRRAVESLLETGYLIQNGSRNKLDFYTKPQPTSYVKKSSAKRTTAAPDACAPVQPQEEKDDLDNSSFYSSSSPYHVDYDWDD